jgi:hypothetical protein
VADGNDKPIKTLHASIGLDTGTCNEMSVCVVSKISTEIVNQLESDLGNNAQWNISRTIPYLSWQISVSIRKHAFSRREDQCISGVWHYIDLMCQNSLRDTDFDNISPCLLS